MGIKVKGKSQEGFSIIQLVLVLGLMSYMFTLALPLLGQWQRAQAVRTTRHGLEQLAQAAVAYRTDESQPWYGTWPATPATLTPRYLPIFSNGNGRGQPYTFALTGTGFTISTAMNTATEANEVAREWASVSSVTGSTLTLGIAIPGQESSHNELLDRAGERSVQGTMVHDPNADIDLGGNDLWNMNRMIATGRITVRNPTSTALIDGDVINGDAMTSYTFRYQ